MEGLAAALVAGAASELAAGLAAGQVARPGDPDPAAGLGDVDRPMVGLVVRAAVMQELGPAVVGSGARLAVAVAGAVAGAVAEVPQALASSAQAASDVAAVHRTRRSRVVMVAMMWCPSAAGPRPASITKSYRLGNDLPKIDITAQLAACVVS
ncbi:hypothetical protein AB0J35_25180 [Nonomuraea angiospora]|uniref:hypothetical protein n=1 Tax=Nonomuraea angiospora TaxID=46172 RepID=UPI0034299236